MISETQTLQSLIVHYERQLHCQATRSQKTIIDQLLHRDYFTDGDLLNGTASSCLRILWFA
ncbi:hypothetical protein [Pectobacterium actinidiae]|uniref:hypothetical protein n=1 Tax=Pectobacterium actinidiae TaxID=1507808 RepID=UPI00383B525D